VIVDQLQTIFEDFYHQLLNSGLFFRLSRIANELQYYLLQRRPTVTIGLVLKLKQKQQLLNFRHELHPLKLLQKLLLLR
jgi:hypothetical protein